MNYVVVHQIRHRVVYSEGPYLRRSHADEVARMLRREEPRTADGTQPIRYTVVPQTGLVRPSEITKYLAKRAPEAA